MRGDEKRQEGFIMLSSGEDIVSLDYPLRKIRHMVDQAFSEMSSLFDSFYAERGRASIPSERRPCEHVAYNILFCWFVGLPFADEMCDHSTFAKNRDRLLTLEVTRAFFAQIRTQAKVKRLLSREHFSVDGILIQVAASLKSFWPREESEGEDRGDGPSSTG